MKTAYIQLVRTMAIQGYTMTVYSEGETIQESTTNTKDIIKAVKDVDQALVVFSNLYTGQKASALVSAYGLEPQETIIDCSLNIESIVDNIINICKV
jgi:hypothetical protein